MRSLAVGLLAVALLAACGGGGGGSSAQPAGSIKVTMTDFKFDPSTISAPSGKVVFWLINASSSSAHDMGIRDGSGKTIAISELVSPGDTFEFDVTSISAGAYKFYCSQPGHEDAGMKGTLTIT